MDSAESRVQWVTRGPYRYLSIDVHAIADEATMRATVDRMVGIMTAEPRGSVLTLVNATDTHLIGPLVSHIRNASATVQPHTRGAAVFGMSKLLRLTFNIVKIATRYHTMAPFETKDEALRWLDQQAVRAAVQTAST
jgi:hypothetical protein